MKLAKYVLTTLVICGGKKKMWNSRIVNRNIPEIGEKFHLTNTPSLDLTLFPVNFFGASDKTCFNQ